MGHRGFAACRAIRWLSQKPPERVIAQVMNIGDYSDVQALAGQVGDDKLLQPTLIRDPEEKFRERKRR